MTWQNDYASERKSGGTFVLGVQWHPGCCTIRCGNAATAAADRVVEALVGLCRAAVFTV
ncbi:hypothetical protein [Paenibacillus oceani]|uniref:Uncharacterized protein n=1 Tax=Paenibacillus oceani TaxID=2772510 RepID=A0A927GZN3_9BACL|nr:hypothetical protein [Paenibacillus oceani]MBD2862262.1 hypothetical protein [Paenibacillus oceani]